MTRTRSHVVLLFARALFLVALVAAPLAHAADAAPAPRERVAILVSAPKPLKVVLQTARQMFAGKDSPASEVTVVVCGKAAGSVTASGEHAALVQESKKDGVRVTVCGLTLKEKGIDPAALAPGVEVVPNGLIEILRLQKLGYRTVEL